MFDRRGDINTANGSSDGIYHHDTRYLSRIELRLYNAPLLRLSSNVQEDNAVLIVDMTNPGMASRQLRGELIHINRSKFIWNAACYERILIPNFDVRPHHVTLSVELSADFTDLFEVHGRKQARRGQVSVERSSDASVALRYLGLDRVERITSIAFEPTPNRLDNTTALFELSLGPGQGARLILRIGCDLRSQGDSVSRRFYTSLRTAGRALRDSSGRAASLDSSNSLFNEMARRSVADLYMVITETEHGSYPFAQEVDPEWDAEPGKILHEMRNGEMARLGEVPFARYYGSVDATPLFVLLTGEYFRRTGDLETVSALAPCAGGVAVDRYLWRPKRRRLCRIPPRER